MPLFPVFVDLRNREVLVVGGPLEQGAAVHTKELDEHAKRLGDLIVHLVGGRARDLNDVLSQGGFRRSQSIAYRPACETCRAFYPIVKNLMAQYPNDVRLVIRYAPFHQGSDQVVKLLESAKSQGKYQTVLEAVLAAQPTWADHGQPNIETAFKVAEQAGLDLVKARQDIEKPGMQSLLQQDIEDLTALQVTKTPTFFVNGRSLPSFGPEQLAALVAEEVAKAKK